MEHGVRGAGMVQLVGVGRVSSSAREREGTPHTSPGKRQRPPASCVGLAQLQRIAADSSKLRAAGNPGELGHIGGGTHHFFFMAIILALHVFLNSSSPFFFFPSFAQTISLWNFVHNFFYKNKTFPLSQFVSLNYLFIIFYFDVLLTIFSCT